MKKIKKIISIINFFFFYIFTWLLCGLQFQQLDVSSKWSQITFDCVWSLSKRSIAIVIKKTKFDNYLVKFVFQDHNSYFANYSFKLLINKLILTRISRKPTVYHQILFVWFSKWPFHGSWLFYFCLNWKQCPHRVTEFSSSYLENDL